MNTVLIFTMKLATLPKKALQYRQVHTKKIISCPSSIKDPNWTLMYIIQKSLPFAQMQRQKVGKQLALVKSYRMYKTSK